MKSYTNFQIFTQLLMTFINKTDELTFAFGPTFPDNNYKFCTVLEFDKSIDALYLDYRERASDDNLFKIYRTSSNKLLMFIDSDEMVDVWNNLAFT